LRGVRWIVYLIYKPEWGTVVD